MKLKRDENLGLRSKSILVDAGHHVCTVVEQRLADRDLIEHCRSEGRCLVTFDLDFANPLVFLPSRFSGIAVLRLPPRPSQDDLLELVQTLAKALQHDPIEGKLWIVERARIRIYQEQPTD